MTPIEQFIYGNYGSFWSEKTINKAKSYFLMNENKSILSKSNLELLRQMANINK
jgi:hypothetical protein